MLESQRSAKMQFQRGSASGPQQGTSVNAVQSYGRYRQRRRVPITISISHPAAERAADNTLLRWHRQQISRWDAYLDERKKTALNFAPGTSADSNILKIYGMLDRTNGDKHYYQVLRIEYSVNVV